MKNILLIFLILFSINSYSQKFDNRIQVGYIFGEISTIQPDMIGVIADYNCVFTSFISRFSYKYFYISNKIDFFTNINKSDPLNNMPFRCDFYIKIGAKYDRFGLSFIHACYHPFNTYGVPVNQVVGGFDKIILDVKL